MNKRTGLDEYEKLLSERIATALICGTPWERPIMPRAPQIVVRGRSLAKLAEIMARPVSDPYLNVFTQVASVERLSEGVLVTTRDEILRGIARGCWALYWADQQEEKGRTFSGMDLYEIAPEAPKWACKWALGVEADLLRLNPGLTLEGLWGLALAWDYTESAETFGYHLGMQSTGHGVGWTDHRSDSDARNVIKLPRLEFYR